MSAFNTHSIIERLEENVAVLKSENETLKQRLVAMMNQLAGNRKENKKVLEKRDEEISKLKTKFSSMCGERNTVCEHLKEVTEDYWSLKQKLNDIIDARDCEIEELKKQLNDIVNSSDDEILILQTQLKDSKSGLEAMRHNWNVAKAYTDDVISQRNIEIAQLKKQLEDQCEFTERAIAQASDTESELVMKNAELTARIGMLSELSERQANTIHDIQIEMMCKHDQLTHTKAQLAHANEMLTAIGTASSYIANVLSHKQ